MSHVRKVLKEEFGSTYSEASAAFIFPSCDKIIDKIYSCTAMKIIPMYEGIRLKRLCANDKVTLLKEHPMAHHRGNIQIPIERINFMVHQDGRETGRRDRPP